MINMYTKFYFPTVFKPEIWTDTLNFKTCATSHKTTPSMTILIIICFYALSMNKLAKLLYLPSTFQTSKPINKLCLALLKEHICLIITSLYVSELKYSTHARK